VIIGRAARQAAVALEAVYDGYLRVVEVPALKWIRILEWRNLRYEYHIWNSLGKRHWVAWVLVRLAYRIKDTEHYQVIRMGESAALILGDAWGSGINGTFRMFSPHWDDDRINERGYPEWREFLPQDYDGSRQAAFDAALKWMYEFDHPVFGTESRDEGETRDATPETTSVVAEVVDRDDPGITGLFHCGCGACTGIFTCHTCGGKLPDIVTGKDEPQ